MISILKNRFVRSYFNWLRYDYNDIVNLWRHRVKNQWIRILLIFVHPVFIFAEFAGKFLWKVLEMLNEVYLTVKSLLAWLTIIILMPWSIGSYFFESWRIKK